MNMKGKESGQNSLSLTLASMRKKKKSIEKNKYWDFKQIWQASKILQN